MILDARTIIALIFSFTIGWVMADIWHRGRQFKVEINKETGEANITPLKKPKQKMEFLTEMDRKELENAENSTSMQTFLGGFSKPAKEEEEEEI